MVELPKNQGIVRTIFFIVNGSYKITLVLYTGMTCYEEKGGDCWLVNFFVVKDLNALLMVMLHLQYAASFINYFSI